MKFLALVSLFGIASAIRVHHKNTLSKKVAACFDTGTDEFLTSVIGDIPAHTEYTKDNMKAFFTHHGLDATNAQQGSFDELFDKIDADDNGKHSGQEVKDFWANTYRATCPDPNAAS